MIKHPGFNNLSEDSTGDSSRDELLKGREPIAEFSTIEDAERDSASIEVFNDKSDAASGVSAGEIEESAAVSDTVDAKPTRGVSGPGGSAAERPAVLDTFSEVERRIKLFVAEKKRLIEERDALQEQLDDARRVIADSEEKINSLLLIKERYKSFTDQQEMVRTKVENLLSLLETEED